jgi:hypothetical protein
VEKRTAQIGGKANTKIDQEATKKSLYAKFSIRIFYFFLPLSNGLKASVNFKK